MKRYCVYFLCVLASACSSPIDTTPCASLQPAFSAPEGWQIFGTGDERVMMFRGGFKMKVDGASNAFHPEDAHGLAQLSEAGHPGNWWGLVTHSGKRSGNPVIQGRHDSSPGYYVSPTELFDPTYAATDPRRYVDATEIPYIALPANSNRTRAFWRDRGMAFGDYAMVYDMRRDRLRAAIFADAGSDDVIGEGSLYLARQFDLEETARNENTHEKRFLYILFPNAGSNRVQDPDEIGRQTRELFEEWGGRERLDACAEQINRAQVERL